MIELKNEINELWPRHGEAVRYPVEFEQEDQGVKRNMILQTIF